MSKNIVSIVIPAYDNPEYTRKTIQSIIDQTHRPIEIIISDDNSPNNLETMVKEKQAFCEPELEIKYYRQKENLNYYFNLQFVLEKAKGKYVVLLDHDDWMIDKNYFADAIKAIEEHPDCFMSIANTFMENTPETFLNFYYRNWHYVDGKLVMKKYLFQNILHPSRSAVLLNLDKLKELNYKQFFISREIGHRLNIMPDEGFVLICLLAAIGKIAITGRVVSVRGLPPNSLSRTNWGGGQKMFIPYFLLYKHFLFIGNQDGVQAMILNLVRRHPCQNIDLKMLKYLNYNKIAIMFMVLGVIWFNFIKIILAPIRAFRKIAVSTLKKFLL